MSNSRVCRVFDAGQINLKRVFACVTDAGEVFGFTFYDDEIRVFSQELFGLTEEQCRALFHKRDIAYLQSNEGGTNEHGEENPRHRE